LPQLCFFDIHENRTRFVIRKRPLVHVWRKSDARRTPLSTNNLQNTILCNILIINKLHNFKELIPDKLLVLHQRSFFSAIAHRGNKNGRACRHENDCHRQQYLKLPRYSNKVPSPQHGRSQRVQ
jgi:hypothetical protein